MKRKNKDYEMPEFDLSILMIPGEEYDEDEDEKRSYLSDLRDELQAYGPDDHHLAYINDDEDDLLRAMGGSGDLNPLTMIPMFDDDGDDDGGDDDGGDDDGGDDDAGDDMGDDMGDDDMGDDFGDDDFGDDDFGDFSDPADFSGEEGDDFSNSDYGDDGDGDGDGGGSNTKANNNSGSSTPTYDPSKPIQIDLDLPSEYLNPGYMRATPYYDTTSPVQARYYWGTQPVQMAEGGFSAETARNIPEAPATSWGVQELQQRPLTAQEIADLIYSGQWGDSGAFVPPEWLRR